MQIANKAASVGAVLGLLVPFILGAMAMAGDWTFFLWPSCVVLAAVPLFGHPILIFAISIALNGVAYAPVFWFVTNLCLNTIALFHPTDDPRLKEK